ncbi:MAG: hypothetical protein LBH40_00785 [Alphaproteobacteria bacterium]|jgi:uncharacterized coiled-coil protein SlyX|nr:hypothetical protein [Alphaproteobacteria bacterium]
MATKKIAEAGIEILPTISDDKIKSAIKRIDKISANVNSEFNRILFSRGGMAGVSSSFIEKIFGEFSSPIESVISVFRTLIGATKDLNNKFKQIENQLTDEVEKQRKSYTMMGGESKQSQIMYNVLSSQKIDIAEVYQNITKAMAESNLQNFKDMDKNQILINMVNEARSKGAIDGKKFLKKINLESLENFLYTDKNLQEAMNEVEKQGGNGLINNSFKNNTKQTDILSIMQQLALANQEKLFSGKSLQERIEETQIKTGSDTKIYNTLAEQIAITNGHLEKLNNNLLNLVLEKLDNLFNGKLSNLFGFNNEDKKDTKIPKTITDFVAIQQQIYKNSNEMPK